MNEPQETIQYAQVDLTRPLQLRLLGRKYATTGVVYGLLFTLLSFLLLFTVAFSSSRVGMYFAICLFPYAYAFASTIDNLSYAPMLYWGLVLTISFLQFPLEFASAGWGLGTRNYKWVAGTILLHLLMAAYVIFYLTFLK